MRDARESLNTDQNNLNISQFIWWGQHYPDTKPDTKRKLQISISYEYGRKYPNEILANQILATYKKGLYTMIKWNLSQKCKVSLKSENQLI